MKEVKDILSVQELANILGISRIAVFNKIKKGQIKAEKVGRNYIIHKKDILDLISEGMPSDLEEDINRGVAKVLRDYEQTLKLLGRE